MTPLTHLLLHIRSKALDFSLLIFTIIHVSKEIDPINLSLFVVDTDPYSSLEPFYAIVSAFFLFSVVGFQGKGLSIFPASIFWMLRNF